MSTAMSEKQIRRALEELELTKGEYDTRRDQLLRKLGWEHRCDFPGGIWLWCKTLGGIRVAVGAGTAITIEENS